MTPKYFKQEKSSTCSLAVLRMALHANGKDISEKELVSLVEKDYGKNFKNIWNPTIAKLACQYGVKTEMFALWPLFKKDVFLKAFKQYKKDPEKLNINRLENPNDKDIFPEPLNLSYKEMFEAAKLGCKVTFGKLTLNRITKLLVQNYLIQTSVKLNKLYPDKKGFHSILIFRIKENEIIYHDPYYGQSLTVSFKKLEESIEDVGAAIAYRVL